MAHSPIKNEAEKVEVSEAKASTGEVMMLQTKMSAIAMMARVLAKGRSCAEAAGV